MGIRMKARDFFFFPGGRYEFLFIGLLGPLSLSLADFPVAYVVACFVALMAASAVFAVADALPLAGFYAMPTTAAPPPWLSLYLLLGARLLGPLLVVAVNLVSQHRASKHHRAMEQLVVRFSERLLCECSMLVAPAIACFVLFFFACCCCFLSVF